MKQSEIWYPPTQEYLPEVLTECGQEELGSLDEEALLVQRFCTTFASYTGDEKIPSYGGKAVIEDDGRPTYAEFAALSLFLKLGWNGMWVDSFRKQKRLSLSEEAQCPESISSLLKSIALITGTETGVFDLVLWRERTILFLELKRLARDRIRNTQIEWIKAALSVGVDLDCFAILQWDLKK